MLWVLYLLACMGGVSAWPTNYRYDKETKCEKIAVPMCRTNSSKYDQTRLPNFIGFTNQSQVKIFTRQTEMQELVKTKCSKDLVFFLCSVLLPICISDWEGANGEIIRPMVPPCRSLCESVYTDCIQSIKMLNVSWPEMLNCSRLPDHDEGICIAPNAFVTTTIPSASSPAPSNKLKASCLKVRRKNLGQLRQSFWRKYDYVFQGKRSGTNKVRITSQSPCTSTKLSAVTQLQLIKSSCRRKFRKSDGEVLILAKSLKGTKQISIEKIIVRASKDEMKKAIKKHNCSNSRKKNNRRQSGSNNG